VLVRTTSSKKSCCKRQGCLRMRGWGPGGLHRRRQVRGRAR
jgi:hypothetical protein